MSKEALISDPHLGCHCNSEVWHKTVMDYGVWLKKELEHQQIENLTIAGDFFDNRNEIGVQTLHIAGKFLDLFCDFNITIIAGNHDMFYKDRNDVNSISIFSGRKNIRVISNTISEMKCGKRVTYAPWGCNISEIQNSDIIIGHLEINGFYMVPGKVADEKTNPKDLLEKAPLVFSGHFHLRDERKFSNGTIIYVGSPYQLNWGESSNIPGYYIIDFSKSTYEFFENTVSPKHIKLTENLISEDIIRNNIVSYVLTNNNDEEEQKIKTKILSFNPIETKFICQSETNVENVHLQYEENSNLLNMMLDFIDQLSLNELSTPVKEKITEVYKKYC